MMFPKPVKKARRDHLTCEIVADRIYSYWRIVTAAWICEYCGQKHPHRLPSDEKIPVTIGVSHFLKRSHQAGRYQFNNIDVFCNQPCHSQLERKIKPGQAYYKWKKAQGYNIDDLLQLKNRIVQRRDHDFIQISKKYLHLLDYSWNEWAAVHRFKELYGEFLR